MSDAIVVGAGLFGQVITSTLKAQGMNVLLLDNREPMAGSWPSASLMKPSWMKSIASPDQDSSLCLLDKLFGVKDLTFKVGPIKVDTVRWCDPAQIQSANPVVTAKVIGARQGMVALHDGSKLEAGVVIVAAGYWCNRILEPKNQVLDLDGRVGAAFFYHGHQVRQNFISPWAPYKQLVAFNMSNKLVWVGDGTALKVGNLTDPRLGDSYRRARRAVEAGDLEPETRIGIRPYVPKNRLLGEPAYVRLLTSGLIVATGGAKNGTIAAGWAAHRISQWLV